MTTTPAQDPTSSPIINSPYEEPQWHWSLGDDGVARLPILRGKKTVPGNQPRPPGQRMTMRNLGDNHAE